MLYEVELLSYRIVILNLYSAAHGRDHSAALPVRRSRVEIGFEKERDAERDPDSKVKRREEGQAFQREGPMVAKDLVWAMVVLTRGTKRTRLSKEQKGLCGVADKGERM